MELLLCLTNSWPEPASPILKRIGLLFRITHQDTTPTKRATASEYNSPFKSDPCARN